MVFGQKEELVFLGREIGEQRDYSEAVAEEIDTQVRKIIHNAYEHAKQILIKYREQLDVVAERLLEVETIDRAEFLELIGAPPDEDDKKGTKPPEKPAAQPAQDEGGEVTSPGVDRPPTPAPA